MENSTKITAGGEIVIYQTPDGNTIIDVTLDKETVWLTQSQMSSLFKKDQSDIARHIKNALAEGEIDESNMQIMHNTFSKYRPTRVYNLDVIISVGYRVHSQEGVVFRKWATSILKEYLIKGYAINPRFEQLERRVAKTEEKIDFFVKTSLPPVEGVFFDGQIYDAYEFVCSLIRSAMTRIVLIDNYVDETVLTIFDKRIEGIPAIIYTSQISQQLRLDLTKHNAQYPPIEIMPINQAHDRFLITDDKVYHIGASLKDLGKKWFAFSLMNDLTPEELISRL
jgi:hypothetical protein